MASKAQDFITRALVALNLFQEDETPPSATLTAGRLVLNEMVSSWALDPSLLRMRARTVIALTASDGDYTIGDGSHQVIEAASVIPDDTATPTTEIPIRGPISLQEWQAIADKTLEADRPNRVYVDESGGVATLTAHVYPVPNHSNASLVLYIPRKVAQFADLNSTSYTFADGVERAIRYNLAIELAANYEGVLVSPTLERLARESLAAVRRGNVRLTEMGFDPALGYAGGRNFNLRTGDYD